MEAQFDVDEEKVIARLMDTQKRDLGEFLFIPKGYNKARILNEVRRRMIERTLNEPRG
jgi:hypothetical protein